MKIKKLVNDLKAEIKKETGYEPKIDIDIFNARKFKAADRVINILHDELGGEKRVWSKNNANGINIEKNNYAEVTAYFDKEGKNEEKRKCR